MKRKGRLLAAVLAAILVILFAGIHSVYADFHGEKFPYHETDKAKVNVTVNISNDGVPILGQKGTPLSHLEVAVPYFDLGLYDMQQFYRYPTDEKCNYTGGSVIQRPTVFHLYIYLLERYYLGYSESECGTGKGKAALSEERYDIITDLLGNKAYETFSGSTGEGRQLLKCTGKATSLYMSNFWGHDENLQYYVNHKYPLMYTDWGASADYILLEDGDIVDLAMFTDWGFYTHGGFAFFPENAYQVNSGSTLKLQTYIQGGSVADETGSNFTTPPPQQTTDLRVYVYNSKWQMEGETNLVYEEGYVSCKFNEAGTYYLLGLESNAGQNNASIAPAVTKVIVKGAGETPIESLTVSGQNGKNEVMCGSSLQMEAALFPESTNGNGVVWSVSGEYASIDRDTGLLKPAEYIDSEQKVIVTAYAEADNSITDSVAIVIKPNPADVEAVRNVERLIDTIGSSVNAVTCTAECRAKIDAAADALAKLRENSSLGGYVNRTKIQFLTDAEERYELLEKTQPTVIPEPTAAPTPTTVPVPTAVPRPTAVPKPTAAPEKAAVQQTKAASTSMTVKWTKDKNASAGYRVYLKGGGYKSYKKVADVSKTITSYKITRVGSKRLKAGQNYTVKVVSLQKKGSKKAESRPLVLKKAVTVTNVPVISAGRKIKAGTVQLKWKKASGAEGYEIQMSTKSKSGYKTVKAVNGKTAGLTQKGLKKGKIYYFRVRSFKIVNGQKFYSTWSKAKKIKA